MVPNMVAPTIATTPYLSNAGNDINGFQNCDVKSRSANHIITIVHRTQVFMTV